MKKNSVLLLLDIWKFIDDIPSRNDNQFCNCFSLRLNVVYSSLKWGRMPKSSSLQMKILTNTETHTWNLRKTFSIFHLLPPLLLFEDMRRLLCLPTCFHDEIPRISFTEPDQLTLTHGVGPWAGSRKKNEEKEEMKKTSFRVSNCFCFLIKFTNDIAKQRCKKRVKSRVSSSPYNDIRPRTTPIVQETHKELR